MNYYKILAYQIEHKKIHHRFFEHLDLARKIQYLEKLWEWICPAYVCINSSDGNPKMYVRDIHDSFFDNITAIFLFGSNDISSAQYTASLFHTLVKRNPDIIVVASGKGGHATIPAPLFEEAEAIAYKKELVRLGVPESAIIVDDTSTNSGANVRNSYQKLAEKFGEGHLRQRLNFVIVQSPEIQLRANLTFEHQWQGNWGYYISSPPQLPDIHSIEDISHINFHLAYALREFATTIAYMYGNPRFISEYDIPDNLIDSIIQLYCDFRGISLQFSSRDEKISFIIDKAVKSFRDIFNNTESEFIESLKK